MAKVVIHGTRSASTTDADGVLHADLSARLVGRHFDEVELDMRTIVPMLSHDLTLDDLVHRYTMRQRTPGAFRISLVWREYPLTKSVRCHECWMYGGAHAAWCQSRGYAAIGPHPGAPPAETQRAPAGPVEECPCGRARAGCTYHDPTLQPEATPRTIEYEVSDVRVFFGQIELRCSEAVPKGAMVAAVSGHRGVFRIK